MLSYPECYPGVVFLQATPPGGKGWSSLGVIGGHRGSVEHLLRDERAMLLLKASLKKAQRIR